MHQLPQAPLHHRHVGHDLGALQASGLHTPLQVLTVQLDDARCLAFRVWGFNSLSLTGRDPVQNDRQQETRLE